MVNWVTRWVPLPDQVGGPLNNESPLGQGQTETRQSSVSKLEFSVTVIMYTKVADPDPHHFGKLDLVPHQRKRPDPDPYPQ